MWHPATLGKVSSSDNWYAVMTVPHEVRASFGKKQVRVSTGTSDKREAHRRLHECEQKLRKKIEEHVAVYLIENAGTEARDELMKKLGIPDEHTGLFDFRTESGFGLDQDGNYEGVFEEEVYLSSVPKSVNSAQAIYARLEELAEKTISNGLGFAENGSDLVTEDEVSKLLDRARQEILAPFNARAGDGYRMSEYLDEKFEPFLMSRADLGAVRKKYVSETVSSIRSFITFSGDLDIKLVKRSHAYAYADSLQLQGKANKTIKKRLEGPSALLGHAFERSLIGNNPLLKLKLEGYGRKQQHFYPFTEESLFKLFEPGSAPYQTQVIWACLIATGMRLDEVALLKREQITKVDDVWVFDLNQADALKDEDTRRQYVPICAALEPIILGYLSSCGDPLFPFRRNADKKTKATNLLMRHMKNCLSEQEFKSGRYGNHSFRGTFKDKARNAGISEEIHNRITGHRYGGIAGIYGKGHGLVAMKEAVDKIAHPYLEKMSSMANG